MTPGVPLSQDQIDAACRLHQHLRKWKFADRCLATIARQFPGVDVESSYLKTAVLDRLYVTNLPDLVRTAEHVHQVLAANGNKTDVALVERIAALPATNGYAARRQGSFASKFAHFFLDCEAFPIMDRYSQRMVAYHLGRSQGGAEQNRSYKAFYAEWQEMRDRWKLTCGCRELDRYLWIAGQYQLQKRAGEKAKLNVELRKLFELPDAAADLIRLLSQPVEPPG